MELLTRIIGASCVTKSGPGRGLMGRLQESRTAEAFCNFARAWSPQPPAAEPTRAEGPRASRRKAHTGGNGIHQALPLLVHWIKLWHRRRPGIVPPVLQDCQPGCESHDLNPDAKCTISKLSFLLRVLCQRLSHPATSADATDRCEDVMQDFSENGAGIKVSAAILTSLVCRSLGVPLPGIFVKDPNQRHVAWLCDGPGSRGSSPGWVSHTPLDSHRLRRMHRPLFEMP